MRIRLVVCGAALLGITTACSDFLSAPDATTNPNQPTAANADQLLVATETALNQQYTSDLARTVCVWMQQCAGTDRQYKDLGVYNYENTLVQPWMRGYLKHVYWEHPWKYHDVDVAQRAKIAK